LVLSILSLLISYLKARPNKAHWISGNPSIEMRMQPSDKMEGKRRSSFGRYTAISLKRR